MIAFSVIAFLILAHLPVESVRPTKSGLLTVLTTAQRLDAHRCKSARLRTWLICCEHPIEPEYVWTVGCIRACLVGWHRSNWHYQCKTWTARPQPMAS